MRPVPETVIVPGFCPRHGGTVLDAEEKFTHPDAVIAGVMMRLVNQRYPRPGVPPCCASGERAFRNALAAAVSEATVVRLNLTSAIA